jgi:hypothetical protein
MTSPTLIQLDSRRRAALAKIALHDIYLVDRAPDGTITLTPAVVRSVIEDKLRQIPGYIEQLERDAAHPETATEFTDWTNPGPSESRRYAHRVASAATACSSAQACSGLMGS